VDDKVLILTLSIIFIVLQFTFKYIDNRKTKEIIRAVQDILLPYVSKADNTHGMMKDLKRMHETRDEAGRLSWMVPKELTETQKEIVELTRIVVKTQEHSMKILDRMEAKLDTHQDVCKQQYNAVDKSLAMCAKGRS